MGCGAIILHDPNAFEEFNISAEGFWRSFAAILPAAVLAWPLFLIIASGSDRGRRTPRATRCPSLV